MAISSINKAVGNGLNKVGEWKIIKNACEKAIQDPAKFAAGAMVTSIVSKDLAGGFLYTSQSLNNKKIPEEKRGFVAALDAVNCVIMVGGQFLIKKVIEKKMTPTLFGKMFSGTVKDKDTGALTALTAEQAKKAKFDNNNIVELVKEAIKGSEDGKMSKAAVKARKELSNAGIDYKSIAKSVNADEQIEQIAQKLIKKIGAGSDSFKHVEKGFGIIVTALATTAFVKRTLAPLISTPLAGVLSDKMAQKTSKKADAKTEAEMRAASTAARFVNNEQQEAKKINVAA